MTGDSINKSINELFRTVYVNNCFTNSTTMYANTRGWAYAFHSSLRYWIGWSNITTCEFVLMKRTQPLWMLFWTYLSLQYFTLLWIPVRGGMTQQNRCPNCGTQEPFWRRKHFNKLNRRKKYTYKALKRIIRRNGRITKMFRRKRELRAFHQRNICLNVNCFTMKHQEARPVWKTFQ